MASIVFTLKKQGAGKPCKVHADVQGDSGPACVTKLQPFMAALGRADAEIERKAEYAEATVNVEHGG